MPFHRVEQGECLAKIAMQSGIANWHTIYDDSHNSELREQRPNPDLLYPGDRVWIPEKNQRTEDCETEQRHRFQLRTGAVSLKIRVSRPYEDDLDGQPYELRVGGLLLTGTVTDDGYIECEVPIGADRAELTVQRFLGSDECYRWDLRISELDPLDTIEGVQARLNNLYFFSGAVDGNVGTRTRAAIRAFQQRHGLTVDGNAGPETLERLREVYGC